MNKNGHQITGVYMLLEMTLTLTLKDQFFEKLTDVLTNIRDSKELRDLNGRTGTEDNNDAIRKYGESVINDNGMRFRH